MATPRENLTAALSNAYARLAEIDAVPITERVRTNYTDAGQTYNWNDYRASLLEQIKSTEDQLKGLQALEGPFTVVGGGWDNFGWW